MQTRLLEELRVKWITEFNQQGRAIAGWFTSTVDRQANAEVSSMLQQYGIARNVNPEFTEFLTDDVRRIFDENVRKITDLPNVYYNEINKVILNQAERGVVDQQSIYNTVLDSLGKVTKKTKRRAELIARDQSAKASGLLTRRRTIAVGITKAIWIHSNAGREPRPDHLAAGLERRVFDLQTGLLLDNAGMNARRPDIHYTWPGHEINCRCVYRPVIEGITDV